MTGLWGRLDLSVLAGKCFNSLSKRLAIMRWRRAASTETSNRPALHKFTRNPFSDMDGSYSLDHDSGLIVEVDRHAIKPELYLLWLRQRAPATYPETP